MALFQRNTGPLARLRDKDFKTDVERTALLVEVAALPRMPPKELTWTLGSPDADVRAVGLKLLARQGGPQLVDALVEELLATTDLQRRFFVRSLLNLAVTDRQALVDRLLLDPTGPRRAALMEVLLSLPPPTHQHLFMRLAAQPIPELQILALTKLQEVPLATADRSFRGTLVKLAEQGPDEVRLAAMGLILRAPEKTPQMQVVVLQAMRDRNHALQQTATQFMGSQLHGGNEALETSLIELLSDGRSDVRSAVIKSLLQAPDRRRVIRAYLSFARSLAGWVRERALDSLKAFKDDLVGPVAELMDDADESIRRLAMLVGGTLEDPRCVPAIIKMTRDPDWWTRITAAETLGRIGDRRAVPALLDLLNDEDTRWSAIDALGRIKDPSTLPRLLRLTERPDAEGYVSDDGAEDLRLAAVEAVAGFADPRARETLERVAAVDPSHRVRQRAVAAVGSAAGAGSAPAGLALPPHTGPKAHGQTQMHRLLIEAREASGSDLHVAPGLPPSIRLVGEVKRLDHPPLTPDETQELLFSLLSETQREKLEAATQLDFCCTVPDAGRYRANIYRDRRGWSGVFRVIPPTVPTLLELGLPVELAALVEHNQGLIVVAGPAGSGKSTTLAALVNLLNEQRHGHVLTIEDPIEFVHERKNCLVNQRELGRHTQSFANALRGALRENPDVIVVGDLRDMETTRIALEAAETGHLVITTTNTTTAARTVESLVEAFPPDEQNQVRGTLSETLKAVVCQALLPHRTEARRVACVELLLTSNSVRTLIREGKTIHLNNTMLVGQSVGMRTMDASLLDLVKKNLITPELGWGRAVNKRPFETFVGAEFLEQARQAEAATKAPTSPAMPAAAPPRTAAPAPVPVRGR